MTGFALFERDILLAFGSFWVFMVALEPDGFGTDNIKEGCRKGVTQAWKSQACSEAAHTRSVDW